MNKKQKGAWVNLVAVLISIAALIYIIIQLFIVKKQFGPAGMWSLLATYGVLLGIPTIFLRKKQSPREVNKDERDSLIEKRAVIAAFVSVWILLFAATIIPRFIFGNDGSIPVWSLAYVNVGILFIVLLVYSIAVLVQYGKGDKNHE